MDPRRGRELEHRMVRKGNYRAPNGEKKLDLNGFIDEINIAKQIMPVYLNDSRP